MSENYKYGFVTDIENEAFEKGLNEDIIRRASALRGEPQFMLDFRLKAYEKLQTMEQPNWGELHFNPVDLVCLLRDYKGGKFDLLKRVDPDAGFMSSKSYQGRDLKALEMPGLWNGAMSDWNTLFVEVPVETFNPVKVVLDLLRPAHQA